MSLMNITKTFDATLLSSSTCGGNIPYGLSGKYVLAEECNRFVIEHCWGKLRLFMILTGVLLLLLTVLLAKHGYFGKEIDFVKKEHDAISKWWKKHKGDDK
jgi:hypothetical protein